MQRKLAKVLLSVFVVYHLSLMMILPNAGSYLGRNFERWMTGYANQIGLNATWNFFAPDPAHTMFLQYNIHFEGAEGEELRPPLAGYIPEEKSDVVIDGSKRRFLYAVRYLMLDPRRLELILGPYFCRTHSGASSVSIRHLLEPIPLLDLVDIKDRPDEVKTTSLTYNCSQLQDEVGR